jgi:Zn-dependent peptidase ImmA (M78 family)/transcriptional regulator with XRE-family HTH domain
MVLSSMYPLREDLDDLMPQFNPQRMTFARIRRAVKMTKLAELTGVTTRTVTSYESGGSVPDAGRVKKIAEALEFPVDFFYEVEPFEVIDPDCVSFRAVTKMSAGLRGVALGAGAIALGINTWIENKFSLPEPDIPNFGPDMSPESAAEATRKYWNLGEQPIKNMVHLLEAKGVRVFSLSISATDVDAFSLWSDGTPFVFLNTRKSAERSRFDAAHELGHIVLHRHGQPHGQEAEKAANAFASAFLMPAKDVFTIRVGFPSLDYLIRAKRRWLVSVAALNYRLHALGLTTEWTNRSLCIQIAKSGYQTNEPNPIPRETSQILEKVFASLRSEGVSKNEIAKFLKIHSNELDELTYGLLKVGSVPTSFVSGRSEISLPFKKPIFKVV